MRHPREANGFIPTVAGIRKNLTCPHTIPFVVLHTYGYGSYRASNAYEVPGTIFAAIIARVAPEHSSLQCHAFDAYGPIHKIASVGRNSSQRASFRDTKDTVAWKGVPSCSWFSSKMWKGRPHSRFAAISRDFHLCLFSATCFIGAITLAAAKRCLTTSATRIDLFEDLKIEKLERVGSLVMVMNSEGRSSKIGQSVWLDRESLPDEAKLPP